MTYDDFIGQVQHRARLADQEEAVRATRVVLSVLARRLYGGEASDLGAQLPEEIKLYLDHPGPNESFDVNEFFRRISEAEGVDLPDAVQHARAVISVLRDAVSPSEIRDALAQLPQGFHALFESGSEGQMRRVA